MGDAVNNLTTFNGYINDLVKIKAGAASGISSPYNTNKDGVLRVSLFSYNSFFRTYGLPVSLTKFSKEAIAQLMQTFSLSTEAKEKTTVETPIKSSLFSSFFSTKEKKKSERENKDTNKKTTTWGILGQLAGFVGSLFYLNNEAEKTPEGRAMKANIIQALKDGVSGFFTKIGEFLTSKDTRDAIWNGLGTIKDAFIWLGMDIYDKFKSGEAGQIGAAVVEMIALIGVPLLGLTKIFSVLKTAFNILKIFQFLLPSSAATGAAATGFMGILAPLAIIIATLGMAALAIERIYASWNIIKNIWEENAKAEETHRNTKNGFLAKNAKRDEKLADEINNLKKKEREGTLTNIESITLKQKEMQRDINFADAQLENTVQRQIERTSGTFGFLNHKELKGEREELVQLNQKKAELRNNIKKLEDSKGIASNPNETANDRSDKAAQELANIVLAERAKNNISNITSVKTQDATIIQPDSKDQILMAKTGGPFDLAMKQMNKIMNERFLELINIATENVHATINGSKLVAQTVASTAGTKGTTPNITSSNFNDPIRTMRNQVNSFIL